MFSGAVEMIVRMFPPFPIPGFAPNFTGYDADKQDINWYEVYKAMAQPPHLTVFWVSYTVHHNTINYCPYIFVILWCQ